MIGSGWELRPEGTRQWKHFISGRCDKKNIFHCIFFADPNTKRVSLALITVKIFSNRDASFTLIGVESTLRGG